MCGEESGQACLHPPSSTAAVALPWCQTPPLQNEEFRHTTSQQSNTHEFIVCCVLARCTGGRSFSRPPISISAVRHHLKAVSPSMRHSGSCSSTCAGDGPATCRCCCCCCSRCCCRCCRRCSLRCRCFSRFFCRLLRPNVGIASLNHASARAGYRPGGVCAQAQEYDRRQGRKPVTRSGIGTMHF